MICILTVIFFKIFESYPDRFYKYDFKSGKNNFVTFQLDRRKFRAKTEMMELTHGKKKAVCGS